MKQRILKTITALLLIMTLTMANFLMLCVNAVTYAADAINVERNTNHKNVEFMAYFKDGEGNEISNLDTTIDVENLKLYINIAIKREGYFNGNIVLKDSNFRLKADASNEIINKIENNKVYLNQINAGESKEIEVGIEILKDDKFDLNFLNMKSIISVEGIYRDSTQKDISIASDRNISLNVVSPYSKDQENVKLTQEIITNKVLKFNGEEKRIIQVQVSLGLNNNLFPIERTIVNINTPKISDKYAEKVLVNSNKELATNGKTLSKDNWNYNGETGVISLNIENKPEDNKISWLRNRDDNFIVTYVFDKDIEINNDKMSASAEIKLYDNKTELKVSNEIAMSNEERDSIVTTEMSQNETSIYKGKIYAGVSRDFVNATKLNVNLTGVVSEINLVQENDKINDVVINSTYKYTKLNKDNIKNVLGENGSLSIVNANTNEIISTISNGTDTDNEGNIIVSYPEGVSKVKINTTSPENIGSIYIENTKTINAISRDIAKSATEIITSASGNYIANSVETEIANTTSNMKLEETETSAYLELNKNEISTMSSNNVEMRVVLQTKNENNELYKNPVIRVQLPSKVENIDVKSVNLVYEDELKIKSIRLIDTNIIEIGLEGQQTKYKEEAIDGAILIINADITTSKKLPSSSEKVVLTYTNENAVNYKNGAEIGQEEKDINLVSYAGVVTINKIPEYGAEIINNEEAEKIVTLEMDSQNKVIKVENEVINNNENKMTDVRVLGTLPNKDAVKDVNNMSTSLQGQVSLNGVSEDRAKVYYSENANATTDLEDTNNGWTEEVTDSKNVKKYLAVINELDVAEGINISYDTEMPESLDYNLNATQAYSVYYQNRTSEEKLDVNPITISTPKGVQLETNLVGVVSGNEANEVKENEVLRYVINIENTGSEEISNVNVSAKVPEGTTFVNTELLNKEVDTETLDFVDENKKQVEFNIEKLKPGTSETRYYEVKVNKGMAGKTLTNTVTTKYGEVTKTSNEVNTAVKEGKLEVKLISADAKDSVLSSGYSYRFVLDVTNTSSEDLKNVNVKFNKGTADLEISQIQYIDTADAAVIKDDVDNIDINKIAAGETKEIVVYVNVPIVKGALQKDVDLSAICTQNNTQYRSNELNMTIRTNLNLSMVATSENSGSYVKAGDIIKSSIVVKNVGEEKAYNVGVWNWIPNDVTLTKVTRNGVELKEDDYTLTTDITKNQKLLLLDKDTMDPGETVTYEIEEVANFIQGSTEAEELINEYSLRVDSFEIETAKIEHILQPTESSGQVNNGGNTSNGNDNNTNQNSEYKIISGVAWIDENENGQKDSNENTVQGITVKLLDVKKNQFATDLEGKILTATTSETGFYSFSEVQKGKYIVIFEYDNTKYGLTTLEKEGVSNEVNSNAFTKTININGTESKVAATEILNVDGENISNINIGLITAKKYDLQLDKFISKVTVQNNKTVSNTYNEATLVKQEIDAKQVNNTMVVVEYTIRVTNKGDVAAYVKRIADYLSVDYKFNSELNKDWYQSGNDVYCTGLANEKIEPGKSKEVTLTVIKEMKENNTGLVNNTAEIVSSYNEQGLTDINSIEGNKVKGENDMGSADLIISIKTGQVVMTISLIIITIVALGVTMFLIRKINFGKKII